jgi:NAD(P)-dependent dehydrogenase (short-subunit alcohol dehydrogenase family)
MTSQVPLDPPQPRALRLDGRVAVITGAGIKGDVHGTGSATACLFAVQGARVVIINRSAGPAQRTLEVIERNSGEAMVLTADVGKADECADAIQAVLSAYGQLDVLVNNAAITEVDDATNISGTVEDDRWQQVVDINMKGPLFLARSSAEALRRSSSASIINVSSLAAWQGVSQPDSAYSGTKGAIISLTRAMANSYGPDGIRVNCIVPGNLHTSAGKSTMTDEEYAKVRDIRRRVNMLRVEGTGWDFAWLALFLASEESRFVTAAVLPVDGGVSSIAPFSTVSRVISEIT